MIAFARLSLFLTGCTKQAAGRFVSPRTKAMYVELQTDGKASTCLEDRQLTAVKYELNGSEIIFLGALGTAQRGTIEGDHLLLEGNDLYREGSAALRKAAFPFESDQCCNNLKILRSATEMWVVDHNGTFPTSLLDLKRHFLNSPVLVCPSDYSHPASANEKLDDFTEANITYKIVPPDNTPWQDRVVIRCPIYGNRWKANDTVVKAGT